MKIQFYKKRMVQINMTENQLDLLMTAVFEFCAGLDESTAFKDVEIFHRMFSAEFGRKDAARKIVLS